MFLILTTIDRSFRSFKSSFTGLELLRDLESIIGDQIWPTFLPVLDLTKHLTPV